MELEEKILELIKSKKDVILQSELWKKAEIDRRKCSRIIDKLEKEGKIIREPEADKGTRTYRISLVEKKELTRDFSLLLVGNRFEQCAGCVLECVPEHCIPLSDWVFYLVNGE
jgi:Lrp/AsnC family leucine-responsive transcriptional regulator